MSSLPYCLTNPKLRMVQTDIGFVTLERIDSGYNVFKDGQNLGTINRHGKLWKTAGSDTLHKNRKSAIVAISQETA